MSEDVLEGRSLLDGISVLVTRPEHQAQGFVDRVVEAGGQALRFPVIEIQEIALSDDAEQILLDKQATDCMIFISANAVRLGLKSIRDIAPQRLEDTRVLAIGKATAAALVNEGVQPDLVPPSPYNSEALLAMPEMREVKGKKYTVIKGKGGRTYLMEQLRLRGAQVNEIDNYVRVKPQASHSNIEQFVNVDNPVIAVTSVKGLHYLFEMVTKDQAVWIKQHARFLVPGARVGDAVRDCHVRLAPWIAENATDPVMMKKLIQSVKN